MHRGSSSDPQRRYEQALAARDAADSKMAEARAAVHFWQQEKKLCLHTIASETGVRCIGFV